MSVKLDSINAAFKDARLKRDTVTVEVIKLILGEIQRLDKSALTDSKIDEVIYKMISNVEDTMQYLTDREKVDQLVNERRILLQFATPEITSEGVNIALASGFRDKGDAMRMVKQYCVEHNLRFNGNVVNQTLATRNT